MRSVRNRKLYCWIIISCFRYHNENEGLEVYQMRKRSVVLGACIFAAFSLTGCKDTETPKGNPTFNATVLEIGENTI